MAPINGTLMALDVGEKRTGVAIANASARLARPLRTLDNPASFYDDVTGIISSENVTQLVVGLPQNVEGDDTVQTLFVREFVTGLEKIIKIPISFQDEADTSRKAEQELKNSKKNYTKADIDSLAATYILQSYIDENSGFRV